MAWKAGRTIRSGHQIDGPRSKIESHATDGARYSAQAEEVVGEQMMIGFVTIFFKR